MASSEHAIEEQGNRLPTRGPTVDELGTLIIIVTGALALLIVIVGILCLVANHVISADIGKVNITGEAGGIIALVVPPCYIIKIALGRAQRNADH